jgi:hypothetical protein
MVIPVAPLEQATLIWPVAFKGAVKLTLTGSYTLKDSEDEVVIEHT